MNRNYELHTFILKASKFSHWQYALQVEVVVSHYFGILFAEIGHFAMGSKKLKAFLSSLDKVS